jgi:hypothetical protein
MTAVQAGCIRDLGGVCGGMCVFLPSLSLCGYHSNDSIDRFMAASKVLGEEAVVPAAVTGEEERRKEREK